MIKTIHLISFFIILIFIWNGNPLPSAHAQRAEPAEVPREGLFVWATESLVICFDSPG